MWTIFACAAKLLGSSATRSEKRQPTAMSRSQLSTAMLLACEPCMPIMPVARGLFPGKPPPPMTVIATGASTQAAKVSSSDWARARTTPPPQMMSGRFDFAIIAASLSMSALSGSGSERLGLTRARSAPRLPELRCSLSGSGVYSASSAVAFLRMSISTGPGRPERAMANASRITSAISSARETM